MLRTAAIPTEVPAESPLRPFVGAAVRGRGPAAGRQRTTPAPWDRPEDELGAT